MIKSPPCHDWHLWQTSPPRCTDLVEYQRPCGCPPKHIPCWQHKEELSRPTPCKEKLIRQRPRCKHLMSVACHVHTNLVRLWEEAGGYKVSQAFVTAGQEYGPAESTLARDVPPCQVEMRFMGTCGHLMGPFPCYDAFEKVKQQEPTCRTLVDVESPLCTHGLKAECQHKASMRSLPWGLFGSPISFDQVRSRPVVQEVNFRPPEEVKSGILACLNSCSQSVEVIRSCKHAIERPCSQLLEILSGRQKLPPCTHRVSIQLPCQHEGQVPCHDRTPPPCYVSVSTLFVLPCQHTVDPGTCFNLQRLQDLSEHKCDAKVMCIRGRCTHEIEVLCHQRLKAETHVGQSLKRFDANGKPAIDWDIVREGVDYGTTSRDIPQCHDDVRFQRVCGHVQRMPCSQAFDWSNRAPNCDEKGTTVSPLCGHEVTLACWKEKRLNSWIPWPNGNPSSVQLQADITEDGKSQEVTVYKEGNIGVPAPLPLGFPQDALRCVKPAMLVRECGHEIAVACADVFFGKIPKCTAVQDITCQECKHVRKVPCRTQNDKCRNKVDKRCGVCNIADHSVECYAEAKCHNTNVSAKLGCGHEGKWKCGTDKDPRLGEVPCLGCISDKWKAGPWEPPPDSKFEDQLRDLAKRKIPDDTQILDAWKIPFDLTLPQKQMKLLRNSVLAALNNPRKPVVDGLREFSGILDMTKYDVVFIQMNPKSVPREAEERKGEAELSASEPGTYFHTNDMEARESWSRREFTNGSTPQHYGSGARFGLLDSESFKCGNDNAVTICVGVIFRAQILLNTAPFHTGNLDEEGRRKSNQQKITQQAQGFDSVDVLTPAKQPTGQRVYWSPCGIPLYFLAAKPLWSCGICLESKLRHEGIHCAQKHFFCWDCYVRGFEAKKILNPNGQIRCLTPSCQHSFSMRDIYALQPPADLFKQLEDKILMHRIETATRSVATDTEERVRAEYERILAIKNKIEQDSEILKIEIIEKILVLKCPRCRLAFQDFLNCCAITCRCGAGFCAWCLQDQGADAHAHVMHCNEKPEDVQGVFCEPPVWEAHQVKRRKALVLQRLQTTEPREVAVLTLGKLHDTLARLGIEIKLP